MVFRVWKLADVAQECTVELNTLRAWVQRGLIKPHAAALATLGQHYLTRHEAARVRIAKALMECQISAQPAFDLASAFLVADQPQDGAPQRDPGELFAANDADDTVLVIYGNGHPAQCLPYTKAKTTAFELLYASGAARGTTLLPLGRLITLFYQALDQRPGPLLAS